MNHKLFLIAELERLGRPGDNKPVELGGEVHYFEAIDEGEDGRWRRTDHHILKDPEGRHWAVPHEVGLTENCDAEGYKDHATEHGNPIHVAAWEVRPVPVQTITWETVK